MPLWGTEGMVERVKLCMEKEAFVNKYIGETEGEERETSEINSELPLMNSGCMEWEKRAMDKRDTKKWRVRRESRVVPVAFRIKGERSFQTCRQPEEKRRQ